MANSSNHMILDFSAANSTTWEAIDDRIMGGKSQSQTEFISDGAMRFSGQVSLDNNGGFASVRSTSGDYDLSPFSGLKLYLRGDGKTYKISLRTDVFFDGVSYQVSFATEAGVWQEITLKFEDFIPTHHGIKLTTVAPMDTAKIRTFGFFIADKQKGPFQLDVARITGAI